MGQNIIIFARPKFILEKWSRLGYRRLIGLCVALASASLSILIAVFVYLHAMSFSYAVAHGYAGVVNRYLKEDPGLLNRDIADAEGVPPIFLAAERGRQDVVELLLLRHARTTFSGMSLIRWAAWNRRPQLVCFLGTRGFILDVFVAAGIGNVKLLRGIAARDPRILNSKDGEGWTPLSYAAHSGQVYTVRWLLNHGADPNAPNPTPSTQTPLVTAARASNAKARIVLALLRHGAKIRVKMGLNEPGTALERIANNGSLNPRIVAVIKGIRAYLAGRSKTKTLEIKR